MTTDVRHFFDDAEDDPLGDEREREPAPVMKRGTAGSISSMTPKQAPVKRVSAAPGPAPVASGARGLSAAQGPAPVASTGPGSRSRGASMGGKSAPTTPKTPGRRPV
jgi:hypothetical protein